jgi:formylglycine-generating enzyme required for sulfatase activity
MAKILRQRKGQSAIEYLTTYGWMLLVIAIVGGAIFTTVQNSGEINSNGFDQGNLGYVQGGFTDQGFQFEMRNQQADQVYVREITLSSEETGETVTVKPDETLPVGDTQTFRTIGLADTSTRSTVDVEVTYDTGGLEGLTSEGSITGAFSLDPEQAEPGNGEWVFVDVSEVNQSTVDTSNMNDFYVMKYEASRQGNATSGLGYEPVSRENHVPWVQISQNEAIDKCRQAGFNLPSNRQWQAATMAEIGNESTQPLGNTNDGSDSDGDSGTGDSTSPNWISRTLTGSGPDTWANTIGVHDLNGNVWEWTSTTVGEDESSPIFHNGTNGHVTGWNAEYAGPTDESSHLGSSDSDFGGDYYWSNSNENSARAVLRGGGAGSGAGAGVFSLNLRYAPSTSGRGFGFRCSFS